MFPILTLTEGAKAVAAADPHGWTLSAICITVVFCSLLILYLVYAVSGFIASGQCSEWIATRRRRKAGGDSLDEETAAAIALALRLYHRDQVHDPESGRLTFEDQPGPWADKTLTLRKYPQR